MDLTILRQIGPRSNSGVVTASAPGVDGEEHPHIITYDPDRTWLFQALLCAKDLTVCGSPLVWLKHLLGVLYAILLMLILGHTCFPDTEMGEGPACAAGKNHRMCQLEDLMQASKVEFRFLIAFVLAGYVGMTVSMWGTRRQNYASLCGNARNLSIQIASLLSVDGGDVEVTQSRITLNRWVMLAYELAVLKPKGLMDAEAGRAYLARLDLLAPGEWEAMVRGDRHSTVFWWIETELVRLCRAGKLEAPFVASLTFHVGSMRGQANDLMSSLDRDKPYAYTSICGVLVTINLWIMSTWKGIEWATWLRSFGDSASSGLASQPKFWLDILMLFAWNISYQGLYDLGYSLHNPFGNRRLDVAHEVIGSGIGKLSAAIARVDGHLPPHLAGERKSEDGKRSFDSTGVAVATMELSAPEAASVNPRV